MVHQAEIELPIKVDLRSVSDLSLLDVSQYDVVFVRLPLVGLLELGQVFTKEEFAESETSTVCRFTRLLSSLLKDKGKLAILGEVPILPYVHNYLDPSMIYQHWIVVRLSKESIRGSFLRNEHLGLTIYTKKMKVLRHAKVRIAYEYCPFCERTTKDYGGKKHLYHEYGTLMSDMWKDITVDVNDCLPGEVLERLKDMFSIRENSRMLAIAVEELDSLREIDLPPIDPGELPKTKIGHVQSESTNAIDVSESQLYNDDAIETMKRIPNGKIDLIFVDPPYNLSKRYSDYRDNLEIENYYEWCDLWLEHFYRILKPGGSLIVVNLPERAMRHFLYLQQRFNFQNWIAWDSLSMPVRFIMPAHYTLLFYTKGDSPRVFNYERTTENNGTELSLEQIAIATKRGVSVVSKTNDFLYPMADKYCRRISCIRRRLKAGMNPKKELTDLWTDIHRLKHNVRRRDHPTQLPPNLVKRVILLLTNPGDIVLDCFNGIGTTTLCAHQLGRRYIGVELSPEYHMIASKRHELLSLKVDPFAKKKGIPKAKATSVPRVKRIKYKIPKKTLQLAVKELAKKLGHIPTRDEVSRYGKYPISYYDEYFKSWSEVTAAARTTGMSEKRSVKKEKEPKLDFFVD